MPATLKICKLTFVQQFWHWMLYLKIDKPVGIKITFPSCPALSQWRRDKCRRVERIITVCVECSLLPFPAHVGTLCYLPLTFSFSHQAYLFMVGRNCLEVRPQGISMLPLPGRDWGARNCGFPLEIDTLVPFPDPPLGPKYHSLVVRRSACWCL